MDFAFPFPTLKHLSMMCIVRHLVSVKLGLCKFPKEVLVRSRFYWIVESLPIPQELMHELYIVLVGMYSETFDFRQRCTKMGVAYDEAEPVFDIYGLFDEFQTWELYFERKLSGPLNKDILQHLLRIACSRTLLPQIDRVLRKIINAEGKHLDRLRGPRHEIAVNKLSMVFRFNLQSSQSRDLVLDGLNETWWTNVYFHVCTRAIEIWFDSMVNIHSFMTHLQLLDVNHRTLYLQTFLLRVSKKYVTIGFIVNVLKLLSPEDQLICLSEVEASDILNRFLIWPGTQIFLPLLSVFGQNVLLFGYRKLFNTIVSNIPKRHEYGVVHGDLLLEFWKMIPLSLKRKVLIGVSESMEQLFDKNHSVYLAIALETEKLPRGSCTIL